MSNYLTDARKSVPSIFKWRKDPFYSVQEAINSAVDDFYNTFNTPMPSEEKWENFAITPAVDVVDTKDSIKFEIEMPGMGIDDVKVLVEDGSLTITGEKTTSHQDKGKNYKSREIAYGYYQRVIPLPNKGVDISKASASFKKGMLWVTVPKTTGCIEARKELKVESADK